MLHSNCVAQGNVLIIQESDTLDPEDNGAGGSIVLTFAHPAKVDKVSLLGIDEQASIISVTQIERKCLGVPYSVTGKNSLQKVSN
jgi:hypothetical protein